MKTAPISATLIDHCGSDLSVVNAARVSFHKESTWAAAGYDYIIERNGVVTEKGRQPPALKSSDVKLIQYLAKHKHTSPFNHAFISVRVKAPIFVGRQLVKHKFMPWNEVSRRYVDDEPEFYFPEVWRAKAENVKQGSRDTGVESQWFLRQHSWEAAEQSLYTYQVLLNSGVCPEQARMVLPQNTMTEWVWSGTLGAFADMLKLRLDSHTQAETREVAEQVRRLIEPLFPVSLPALLGE